MFKYSVLLGSLLVFLLSGCSEASQTRTGDSVRVIIPFDTDWQFIQSDASGAESPKFDDSKWLTVNVPHDWSIKGPYSEDNKTGHGGGYLPAGIGWYRKTFTLDTALSRKKVSIQFDGIMANSDVWVNGFHLGHRPNGYVSFSYDLTDHLQFGQNKNNIIAVRVNDSLQPASRYYTGAGIYRHVRLVATNPVHISHWGVYITTPHVSQEEATIKSQTNVVNESSFPSQMTVKTTIISPSGKAVKSVVSEETITPGDAQKVVQKIKLTNPSLWGIEQPDLYTAVTKILVDGKVIDNVKNVFGIRNAVFKAATGFWLNGKNIKIKGVCLHHDVGCLGAAVPLTSWKRRFRLLKKVGVNAIRTAHNPPAPEFLDLCDKMGFLVMDEAFDTWDAAKNHAKYGYNLHFDKWWKKDLTSMIMRDRNHPSIIIYSVGNEIRDNLNDSAGFRKYRNLQNQVHELDPSRPVTMALFRPGSSHVYTNGLAKMMDVVGQNYRENELVAAHETHSDWKVIGTENGQSREAWLVLRDKPYMAGQFLWVGFDYLGEAEWPGISYPKGLFSRTGQWYPNGYQRQSWWAEKPVIHIVRKRQKKGFKDWTADWTPVDPENYKMADVRVYSNCDEVELLLNGKSLGTQSKPADDAPRVWKVPYEKGTIKAIGKNKGKEVASDVLETAGTPAKIVLETEHDTISDTWNDVSYVTVKVVDENNVVCPHATDLITFSLSGSGKIIGVDNGNPVSHEFYQATHRHAYQGRCIAVIRARGKDSKIMVTASSPGLKEGSLDLVVK